MRIRNFLNEVNYMAKKIVSIYLEDWQVRLIKDVSGQVCHIWDITVEVGPMPLYGVHQPVNPKEKRMYLTTWQKTQLFDEAGFTCNFVEIKPGMIFRYGLPLE
jgi:hypothetical protein